MLRTQGINLIPVFTYLTRTQSHAASAVINFCESCDPKITQSYASGLLEKLYALLAKVPVSVASPCSMRKGQKDCTRASDYCSGGACCLSGKRIHPVLLIVYAAVERHPATRDC